MNPYHRKGSIYWSANESCNASDINSLNGPRKASIYWSDDDDNIIRYGQVLGTLTKLI